MTPLFKKLDCLLLPVPNLEEGLAFYSRKLGHELIWRTEMAAGLRLPDTDAELVIHAEFKQSETDILVDNADDAATAFEDAGGEIVKEPFDIQIGRCTVVRDPFGNVLVLLDMSKGKLKVDAESHVIGNEKL
ncbi:MAG: VOC family protein [Candidatus Sungbacteria bacterium]|nr:VOC family protein [Candidatus Sungbacteria bacterium]